MIYKNTRWPVERICRLFPTTQRKLYLQVELPNAAQCIYYSESPLGEMLNLMFISVQTRPTNYMITFWETLTSGQFTQTQSLFQQHQPISDRRLFTWLKQLFDQVCNEVTETFAKHNQLKLCSEQSLNLCWLLQSQTRSNEQMTSIS